MLNVNQLTSTLAKLSDQALQQYAAMHKEDPYVMSLAVAEANRRKEMRSAVQGAQGGEQPKVADQILAGMAPAQEMLPEDQGIARLPTGDMNFADGGIVAFADGGDVERYELGGTTSALRSFLQATGQMAAYLNGTPAERAAIERAAQVALQGPIQSAAPGAAPAAATPTATAAQVAAKAAPVGSALLRNTALGSVLQGGLYATQLANSALKNADPEQLKDFYKNPMVGAVMGDAGLAAAIMNEGREAEAREAPQQQAAAAKRKAAALEAERARNMSVANSQGFTRAGMANDPRLIGSTPAAESVGTQVFARNNPPPRQIGAGMAGAGDAASPRAGGFDLSPQGLMNLRKSLGEQMQVKEPDDIREAREALNREEVAAAEARKAGLAESHAKFADAFKGREERISKREADLEKRGNQNMGLALLQAGAAMMSTPGGLAMALGKGVRVGTEQYAAGLDNLRSAREKLDEARDRMDDLKLNRDMMNDKEIRDAEAGIRTAQIEGRKRGVAALADMFQVSNKRADSMFDKVADAGMVMYKEGQANARNAASVNAQRNTIDQRVFSALVKKHGGDEVKAYQEYVTSKQEPKTDSSLVAQYAKDPTGLALLEKTDPALAAMIRSRIQASMVPPAVDVTNALP